MDRAFPLTGLQFTRLLLACGNAWHFFARSALLHQMWDRNDPRMLTRFVAKGLVWLMDTWFSPPLKMAKVRRILFFFCFGIEKNKCMKDYNRGLRKLTVGISPESCPWKRQILFRYRVSADDNLAFENQGTKFQVQWGEDCDLISFHGQCSQRSLFRLALDSRKRELTDTPRHQES